MGGQEEFMGASDLAHQMVKGRRRTKRLRSPSPHKAVASASLSSGFGGGVGGGGSVGEEHHCSSISSPATSSEIDIDSTEEEEEEEEDMANCLILLAQGEGPKPTVTETAEKFSARDFSGTVAAPTASRTGFYVNYCKTCKRSFQSFQALGGHRATHHRKPKATAVEQKKAPVALSMIDPDDDCQLNKSCSLDDPISHRLASNNNKIFRGKMAMKTHECSICGSQFTSGQALGGHMRRHRANAGNHMGAIIESVKTGEIKPRNILPLDLNLPAPENDDDHGPETDTNFQFASKQQALVFSAPALVDCHY